MNTKTVINLKTDKDVKVKAKKLADKLGIPLSTIINSFLKQFIREKKVTFSVEPEYRLKPEVKKVLRVAEQEAEYDGPFKTEEELRAYFKSLDKDA